MATKYLYFWGHTPKQAGTVGPECLSQWYPAPFEVDGVRFATAEHYMMWGKARLFGDEEPRRGSCGRGTPTGGQGRSGGPSRPSTRTPGSPSGWRS